MMCKRSVTVFFLFFLEFTSAFDVESKSNLFEKCINSALQPLEYTLGKTIYVIISMDRNDEEGVILAAMTIRRLNQTVIIANKILRFFNEFHRLIPSGYLIVISSLENLERMLKRIDVEHYNWYPRSRFVIVFSKTNVSPSNTARHSVEKAVIMLREYDINDVLVLSVDLHNTVQAFVWFPFSVRNQCRSEVHVTLLDRCTFERSTFVKNLYPSKIPFKFRGCTVTMSGFHWPPYVYVDDQTKNFNSGYNVETMNLLAERHNLTLRQILPEEGSRWGSLLDNGTWTGGLGLLQNSKADVSMGGSLETVMRINRFDFSNTYNSIYMKFYLLLPSKLPHWKNMIDIFSPEFWAIILAVYFIISAMMYFVSILNRDMEKEYYKNFANCLLTLWKVAFGNSANCIPNSPAVRIILLLWLVYNFHITLVYTSSLLSFITKPAYQEPIRTLEQVSKSHFKIIMVKQFVQISSKMDEDFKAILASKADPLIDHVETMDQMIKKRDLIILDTADHFEIFAKDKLSSVYSLDDFVRLNPCLYLKKGSIFTKYLDDIQMRIHENGMFQKWEKDYRSLNKNNQNFPFSRNHYYNDKILSLTLTELSGSFYILLSGLIISFVVFVLENFIFLIQNRAHQ